MRGVRKLKDSNLSDLGISLKGPILYNLSKERLVEECLINKEANMSLNGAINVDTGKYTGRSPKDKYFVEEDSSKDNLWWGEVNQKVDIDVFNELYDKVIDFYNKSDSKTYIFDGYAGADDNYKLPIRVIAKKAWQSFFANNMFIRPSKDKLASHFPEFTIINASDVMNEKYKEHGLNSETFVMFNLDKKIAIIGGTEYGGEMKKGIFSILHYYLPLKGVLSMHCSANVDNNGDNAALFFGLSGTGKTTLSTDPNRPLIGDDEHGWSDDGIFNFEGGCYAKVINLNKDDEPDIYNAIRHGAMLENVVFNLDTNEVDFSDGSNTENTRVSYPLDYIENSVFAKGSPSVAGHPKTVIFLTCDAYGILPPVSKLSIEQSMYHFISGYTAKVAGTERGVTEPQATFSPCYGGPFLTLHPLRYAKLLKEKIEKFQSKVYLVNTGWNGGSAQSGAKRISIKDTRAMITSILNGSIENSEYEEDKVFGLNIPKTLDGVNSKILNPREAWDNKSDYDNESIKLAQYFIDNFKKYGSEVEYLEEAGPRLEKIGL
mgnify:FL=1